MPAPRYGKRHQRLRGEWASRVERGEVTCARCQLPIEPGTPWHLDHADDGEASDYLGPSHEACNVSAANRRHNKPEPAKVTCRFHPNGCGDPHPTWSRNHYA